MFYFNLNELLQIQILNGFLSRKKNHADIATPILQTYFVISSKCNSLHTKLKSGERHSDEESFVDESTKIITKGTFF